MKRNDWLLFTGAMLYAVLLGLAVGEDVPQVLVGSAAICLFLYGMGVPLEKIGTRSWS